MSKIGADAVSRLLGLISLPIIARSLNADGYGTYSYSLYLISYFGFFIDFGFFSYGVNEICSGKDIYLVGQKIISLQIVISFTSFLVTLIVGFFIFNSDLYVLIFISSFGFLFQPFLVSYYYIATNKLYFNSIAQLISQSLFVLLVLFVFKKIPDLTVLIIITLITGITNSLILFVPYYKTNGFRFYFSIREFRNLFRDILKLGLSSKFEAITISIIPLVIGIYLSNYSVGIYSAAFKLFTILLAVIVGFQQTFIAIILRAFKNYNSDYNAIKVTVLFYSYLMFGIILGSTSYFLGPFGIKLLYGEGFLETIPLIKYISLAIGIWPIVMFLNTVFLANNKYNYYLTVSAFLSIISTIFSFSLIKLFGLEGASLVLPLVAILAVIFSSSLIIISFKLDYFLNIVSLSNLFKINYLIHRKSGKLLTEEKNIN